MWPRLTHNATCLGRLHSPVHYLQLLIQIKLHATNSLIPIPNKHANYRPLTSSTKLIHFSFMGYTVFSEFFTNTKKEKEKENLVLTLQ